MKNELPWTHYAPTGKPNSWHAFTVDHCEVCGCEVEGANAVGLHEPECKLIRLGMVRLEKQLPDMGHCETLGVCTCPDCYID